MQSYHSCENHEAHIAPYNIINPYKSSKAVEEETEFVDDMIDAFNYVAIYQHFDYM